MLSTILLIWAGASFVLESIIRNTPGEFGKTWKKVLFYVLTLPTMLWVELQKLLGKGAIATNLSKIGAWFKL